VAISLLLVIAVFAVFGQTLRHDFVSYDDALAVYENRRVLGGFTLQNVRWAFTETYGASWLPLTALSHMLDVSVYGLQSWGHHLTSVLLHAINAVLLFAALRRMTKDFWPSAFVAFIFAVHPLRAETVAWVAERRDVLSGFFWILTLWLYARYAERPAAPRYAAVVLCFGLGLMAKPMLVTLPFVLLLLDYWPLGRLLSRHDKDFKDRPQPFRRLLLEKLPLLGLAAASSIITVIVQHQGSSLPSLEQISIPFRLTNALVSYAGYIGKFFWPTGLAVFYPYPLHHLASWPVARSVLILAALSLGVFAGSRRAPCLAVGWLWYLGTLVPVIGLLQVGQKGMADRYTYLTQIGLTIMLAWGMKTLFPRWRQRPAVLAGASIVIVIILMIGAWRQTAYWKDTLTLFRHTLACTPPNSVAHASIAEELDRQEHVEEALEHYRKAVEIDPTNFDAHYNWGNRLSKLGRIDEAIAHYLEALRYAPGDSDEILGNLGTAYEAKGDLEQAARYFIQALQIAPETATTHYNLGVVFSRQNRRKEAIRHFHESLRLDPNDAEACYNLGLLLMLEGKKDEAIPHLQRAVSLAESAGNPTVQEQARALLSDAGTDR
jgi:Flp pilus assembly protein TadD